MRVPTIAGTADSSVSAASTAITAAMAAINPIVVTRRVRGRAARAGAAQNQPDHPVGGIDGHLLADLTTHRPAHQIKPRDSSASASASRSCTIRGTVTGSGDGLLVVAIPRLSNTRWSPSSCPDQQPIPVGHRTGAPHHLHQPQTVVPPVR